MLIIDFIINNENVIKIKIDKQLNFYMKYFKKHKFTFKEYYDARK